ncbi:MAG: hypothetical protein ACTSRU_03600 [Candidatus Hodarchaeales archaeon]
MTNGRKTIGNMRVKAPGAREKKGVIFITISAIQGAMTSSPNHYLKKLIS